MRIMPVNKVKWISLILLTVLLAPGAVLRADSPPEINTGNQAGVLTVLYSFRYQNCTFNSPDIKSVNLTACAEADDLIQGSDGDFYGTYGGNNVDFPNGVVFKVTLGGSMTPLYSFNGGDDGATPVGGLAVCGDGNYYGVTESGGTHNCGTIFQILSSGSGGWRYSFAGAPEGEEPEAELIAGPAGNFYGTTQYGGANNCGTVFKVTTDGSLTTLYSFTGGDDGAGPVAALVSGNDGRLYGTTADGGAFGAGTVFRIAADGSVTPLCSFNWDNGAHPHSRLSWGEDGNLYGTTYEGGINGYGTTYRITPGGVMTSLHSFNLGDGAYPRSGLLLGSDGNFYGTTEAGGDAWGEGTAFKLTPGGVVTTLYSFGWSDGIRPANGLTQGRDGNFYGMTSFGGAGGGGTIFKLTPPVFTAGIGRSFSYRIDATGEPDHYSATGLPPGLGLDADTGIISGTATVTGTYSVTLGAENSAGSGRAALVIVVFMPPPPEVDTGDLHSILTTLHEFGGGDGANPQSGLVSGSDGNFYGTTCAGGDNNLGTVYSMTTSGSLITLCSFDGSNGSYPYAGVVQGRDGNFYGTTYSGGENGMGTVYAMSVSGTGAELSGSLTTLYSFGDQENDGANPYAGLMQGSDGRFYGTTYLGGSNSMGTVYAVAMSGSQAGLSGDLTTLCSFTGTDGANPCSGLVQGSDGGYYGTTQKGGPLYPYYGYTFGTVYKISSTGSLNSLYFFSGIDGVKPSGTLVQAEDGSFYGTTEHGGWGWYDMVGNGTVFKITQDGVKTTVKYFDNDSRYPHAGLVSGSDGNYYGTTRDSIDYFVNGRRFSGGGIVFKITSSGSQTILHSFCAEYVEKPSFTGMVERYGAYPYAGLLLAGDGDFYGTTSDSGMNHPGTWTYDYGTIYRITPPALVLENGIPFSYQINATNLPNRYEATGLPGGLAIDNNAGVISGTPAATGSFNVMISAINAGGTGSAMVKVVVLPPLGIAVQPQSVTQYQGQNITLSMTGSWDPSLLTYQWQKNGEDLPGETSPDLTLENVQPEQTGDSYNVTVHGGYQSRVVSDPAIITVIPLITSLAQPASLDEGMTAVFGVATPDGAGALSYQWQKDGVNLPGQTGATLTLDNIESECTGNYRVIVTNDLGNSITSQEAALNINGDPFWIGRGLVAYYPFNNSAADATPYHHDGTSVNVENAADRYGMENRAALFSGSNSYVDYPDSVFLPSTVGFTWSAWVQADQFGATPLTPWLVMSHGASSAEAKLSWNGLHYNFSLYFPGWWGWNQEYWGWHDGRIDVPTPVQGTGLTHLVCVYKRGARAEIWVNGTLSNSLVPPGADLGGGDYTVSSIGAQHLWWWGVTNNFKGIIDDVRIYNRALSSTEVQQLFDVEGPVVSTPAVTPDPDAGFYTDPVTVNFTDATPGAAIYYTTDGSEPTVQSTLYSGPVVVIPTTTLKARAFLTGSSTFGSNTMIACYKKELLQTIPDQTVNEYTGIAFSAASPGSNVRSLVSYSLGDGAPAGAAVNPVTGWFSWTPVEGQGTHAYTLAIIANDSELGLSATQSFQVTVNHVVISAPQISPIPDQTAMPGGTVAFAAQATDLDVSTGIYPTSVLQYSLGDGVPGAIDPNTGSYSWSVPASWNGGDFALVVIVSKSVGIGPVLSATASVTIHADTIPPTLSAPRYQNTVGDSNGLLNGFSVSHRGAVFVSATSAFGVAKVDFYDTDNSSGDTTLLGTCSQPGASGMFSATWPVDLEQPGIHTIQMVATDNCGLVSSTLSVAGTIVLPLPGAPLIFYPSTSGTIYTSGTTSLTQILISGTAQPGSRIQLFQNGVGCATVPVDVNGGFTLPLALAGTGANDIHALAINRSGTSGESNHLIIALDNSIPSAPLGLTATAIAGGKVRLTWQQPASGAANRYTLIRAAEPDSLSASGTAFRVNNTTFVDAPPQAGGTCYYWVNAVGANGVDGDLSNRAAALPDAQPPRVVSLTYSLVSSGAKYDAATDRFGAGWLAVTATMSKPLAAIPQLFYSIAGGSIGVTLVPVASDNLTYSGSFRIMSAVASGTATAVLSARDLAGNIGHAVDEGGSLVIRTSGPAITAEGTGIPQTLKVTGESASMSFPVELDEQVKTGSDGKFIPPIFYLANSGTTNLLASGSLPATSVVQSGSDGRLWQVSFTSIPVDVTRLPGCLVVGCEAVDDFDNVASGLNTASMIAVYSDASPLLVPLPVMFAAVSGSGGLVSLSWQPVDTAAGYNLYRATITQSGTGGYSLVNVNGLITGSTAWTDCPAVNSTGTYSYGVTSVRVAGTDIFESTKTVVSALSVGTRPPAVSGAPSCGIADDGSGIRIEWSAVDSTSAGNQYFYNLFRSDNTANAILVSASLTSAYAVDPNPDPARPFYFVTVVDRYGNVSGASTTGGPAFGASDLLPVGTLSVTVNNNVVPRLDWSWDSSRMYDGFDIYLVENSGSTLLTSIMANSGGGSASYADIGYVTGTDRVYSVVPYHLNGAIRTTGMARAITLPQVSVTADADNTIVQGVMNRLGFTVESGSSQPIQNARVRVSLSGTAAYPDAFSPWFNLAANSGTDVNVRVPGYELPVAPANAIVTLVCTPQAGETVSISNSYAIPVQPGGLGLQIMASNFVRGGIATAQFSVVNPGVEPLKLLVASPWGQAPSTDIRFKLVDQNGGLLSTVPFMQVNQSGTIAAQSGPTGSILSTSAGTFLTLPPNGSFITGNVNLPIPSTAPDVVTVQLEIDRVYSADGSVTLPVNISTRRQFGTMQTAYSGVVTGVTFNHQPVAEGSAIDVTGASQTVTLSGSACYRGDSPACAANVPLVLAVSVNGFERDYNINTNDAGAFSFNFQPDPGERGGIYSVWVRHPDVQDAAPQRTFILSRVTSEYGLYQLVTANNIPQTMPLRVYTGHGTVVNHVTLVCTGTAPGGSPGAPLPEGITVTSGTIPVIGEDSTVMTDVAFKYTGPQLNHPIAGKLFFQLVSDEQQSPGWQNIELDYQIVNSSPVLQVTPSYIDTGIQVSATSAHSDTETVTLTNIGQAVMEDVTVSLQGAPGWMNLISRGTLGSIKPGASHTVTLYFNPQINQQATQYPAQLVIQSSNTPKTAVGVSVNVTQSGVGDALIHVGDIYTTNEQSGLAGANVVLESEFTDPNTLAGAVSFSGTTDATGQAYFQALPAGWYHVRVSAEKHNSTAGRIDIKPGQQAYLDVNLPYSVVSLTWSVVPVQLQDEYNIVLNATYETRVPAPVVVVDPPSFNLPDLYRGDVYNGQITLTNMGLVAASNLTLAKPADDAYFKYELLNTPPSTLDPGQVSVVSYRVTCLTPPGGTTGSNGSIGSTGNMKSPSALAVLGNWKWLKTVAPMRWQILARLARGESEQGMYRTVQNSPSSGAGGCWTYSNCFTERHFVSCEWNPSLGYWATNYVCTAKSGGNCATGGVAGTVGPSGPSGGGNAMWQFLGTPTGAGPAVTPSGQSLPTLDGQKCFPPTPDCGSAPPVCPPHDKCQDPTNGPSAPSCDPKANNPAGSWVNLPSREYRDYVDDLSFAVPGGNIAVGRDYSSKTGRWKWNCIDYNLVITFQASQYYLTSDKICGIMRGQTRFTPSQLCPPAGSLAQTGSNAADSDAYRVFYNDWQLKTEKIVVTYDPVHRAAPQSIMKLRWSDNNGHWCDYDGSGKLTAAGTRDLTLAQLHYDAQQRLRTITSGSGSPVTYATFAYAAGTGNRLANISDAMGRSVSYGYDNNGLLTSCTTSFNGETRLSASYSYDAHGRMTGKTTDKGGFTIGYDNAGYVRSVTDAGGGTTTYDFDYDPNNLLYYARFIDADGRGTERYFDQLGRLTTEKIDGIVTQSIIYNGFNQTLKDDQGRTTSRVYDENNNLVSETLPDGARTISSYDPVTGQILRNQDTLGNVTQYHYDTDGNLASVTEGYGTDLARTTNYGGYDQHRPSHVVDPAGIITDTVYTPTGGGGESVQVTVTGTDNSTLINSREYDPAGNLTASTDALGHRTEYVRDYRGRTVSETNTATGLSTIYTYDPVSRDLVQVEEGRLVGAPGRITKYAYDAMHRRTATLAVGDNGVQMVRQRLDYNAAGRVVSETDAMGNAVSYIYDSHGNQTFVERAGATVTANTYDTMDHLIEVDTPTGAFGTNVTRMTYDFAGRIVTRISGTGGDTRTVTNNYLPGGLLDSVNYSGSGGIFATNYRYDLFGRRIAVSDDIELSSTTQYNAAGQVVSVTDGNGNPTVFGYDGFGRSATQTRGTGSEASTTRQFYDANGNVLETVDGAGNRQYFKYDALGRRTDQSVPTKQPFQPGWESVPQNVLSHADYDAWGDVVGTRDAVGGVSSSIYDSLGRLARSTDKNGLTLIYHYDNLGRVASVDYPAVASSSPGRSTAIVYQYDPARPDWLVSVTDRAGNTTQITYDIPSGLKLTEVTSLGGTTHYAYDSLGRTASVTDPYGNTTGFYYDQFDRVTRIVYPDDGSGNPNVEFRAYDRFGHLTDQSGAGQYALHYDFDNAGNMIAMTDGNKSMTQWDYDSQNRMRTKTYADGKHYDYTYYGNGTVATRTDGKRQLTRYDYNAYGLLHTISYPNDPAVGFGYDSLGRMVQMTDVTGTTSYRYSASGLLLSCTQNAAGRALIYGYDVEGHRSLLVARDIGAVSASGTGTFGAWQMRYTHDSAGRLEKIYDDRVSVNPFQYVWTPGANLVDHINMPNGVVEQKAYDQGGRLTGISLVASNNNQPSTINSLSYGYNALSLRVSEQNAITSGSRSFGYDAQRQLKEVDTTLNSQPSSINYSFTYDPIGNWLSQTTPLGTGTFGANCVNEYTGILLPGGIATVVPVYDDNGNLTDNGAGTIFTWDDENRLISATTLLHRVEFGYNGLGWRVEKRVYDASGSILQKATRFVYDGVNMVEELDYSPGANHPSLVRSCTQGLDLSRSMEGAGGVGGLLCETIPGSASALHLFPGYDGNGNVTDLVDDNGTRRAHYEYSPFGSLTAKSGDYADANPFRWSTKYQDDETGLVYYGFRYYWPGAGRWINKDPIEESGGVNLYAMVGNNPYYAVDGLGLNLYAIDGTGNDESFNSNIVKFRNRYNDGDKYYYRGPGNPTDGNTWFGPGWGAGSAGIVKKVTEQICKDFTANPNIKIDIVGFSRGSAIANEIATVLKQNGCKCKKYNNTYFPEVRFLGLFDPVYSLPIADQWMWNDKNIPSNVNNAAIAYARDERRKSFRPAMLSPEQSSTNFKSDWFPGVHSDVGGTNDRNILIGSWTLRWMIDQATSSGVVMDRSGLINNGQVIREAQKGLLYPFQNDGITNIWND
jgi:RHS repeat-associated protein